MTWLFSYLFFTFLPWNASFQFSWTDFNGGALHFLAFPCVTTQFPSPEIPWNFSQLLGSYFSFQGPVKKLSFLGSFHHLLFPQGDLP